MEADVFAAVRADGTGVDYATHNKGVTPEFLITEMVDMVASEKAGREIRVPIETVLIRISGDLQSAASHPVDAGIIARFPEAYKSWKASGQGGGHINGTPLSEWALMSPARIRELEQVNIWSVEDLASVAETNLMNITDGRAMREKAREHLTKETTQSREIDALKEGMAELKEMMSLIAGKLVPKETSVRKGWPKGKPRKPIIEAVQGITAES